MDLLNGKTRPVLHRIGDHTKCGPSCQHSGKDLRVGFGLYERLVDQYGDPKALDARFTFDTLIEMSREDLVKELVRVNGNTFGKLKKLSTVQLQRRVAKLWGLEISRGESLV